MDGSRIRKEKYVFSNQNRYVWAGLRLLCAFFLATDKVIMHLSMLSPRVGGGGGGQTQGNLTF